MQGRNCPNCGAPIPIGKYICEYCGTTFKEEYSALVVKYDRPDVRTIQTSVVIPDYARNIDSKRLVDYTLTEMKNQIAEALTGLIEIQASDDPVNMQTVYRGRVRVLDPTFRF